jgi:hypothetical protein
MAKTSTELIVIASIFSGLFVFGAYNIFKIESINNSLKKSSSQNGGTKKRSKKACNRKTKGKR